MRNVVLGIWLVQHPDRVAIARGHAFDFAIASGKGERDALSVERAGDRFASFTAEVEIEQGEIGQVAIDRHQRGIIAAGQDDLAHPQRQQVLLGVDRDDHVVLDQQDTVRNSVLRDRTLRTIRSGRSRAFRCCADIAGWHGQIGFKPTQLG